MKLQITDNFQTNEVHLLRKTLHQKINFFVGKEVSCSVAEQMSNLLNITRGEHNFTLEIQTKINKIRFGKFNTKRLLK